MTGRDVGSRMAIAILVVLTAINFLNYLDRYVLSAVLQPLSEELTVDDDAAGLLGTAFMVVYMVFAPIAGHFGDRFSRHRIAAAGVALWSLATMGSGLADDYGTLLLMRAAVGIGEAGYATVAPAVIADLFGAKERGRKLAWFYLAIPLGSAMGYLVGGAVGQAWGWRAAFFVAGAPGLVMAVVIAMLPEPRRGASDDEPTAPAEPLPVVAAVRRVWRSPAWRINVIGTTLMTFAMGGIAFWMPTYLVRAHQMSLAEANTTFGAVTVVAGLTGTLLGGRLGDRAFARRPGGYFTVSGWGLLLGAPFAALMPMMPTTTLVFVCAFFAEVLLFLNTGPLNAALVACVPSQLRARAVAINVFFIHALGDAISPPLIGVVSTRSALGFAVGLTAVPIAAAGLSLLYGARATNARKDGLLATD
ncbi:MAG: MFS transporter [Myxococcota bacterium]